MESLFNSAQSSPIDVNKLETNSVTAATETDIVTPRSPVTPVGSDSRANSAESYNKSDGSSFPEKLRQEVDLGKGQELPFSPKKSKEWPCQRLLWISQTNAREKRTRLT